MVQHQLRGIDLDRLIRVQGIFIILDKIQTSAEVLLGPRSLSIYRLDISDILFQLATAAKSIHDAIFDY